MGPEWGGGCGWGPYLIHHPLIWYPIPLSGSASSLYHPPLSQIGDTPTNINESPKWNSPLLDIISLHSSNNLVNRLCGICGNYDGDKGNDAVDAFGEPVDCGNGRKCKNPAIGNSWKVPDFGSPQK